MLLNRSSIDVSKYEFATTIRLLITRLTTKDNWYSRGIRLLARQQLLM